MIELLFWYKVFVERKLKLFNFLMDYVSEFLLRLKIAPIYSKTHFYGNYFNIFPPTQLLRKHFIE